MNPSDKKLNKNIKDFIHDASVALNNTQRNYQLIEDIKNTPLISGQAIYLVDYVEQKVVFNKGIKDLLGYEDDEFTLALITDYFHPKQKEIVLRLIKAAINYGVKKACIENTTFMSLIYKVQKKNKEYVTILRQTRVIETDKKGRMLTAYSVLSDLTGLYETDKVEWKIVGENVDLDGLRKYINSEYNNIFTKRETQIIQLIKQGISSTEIAAQLFLSKHTVDTHRRNILSKTQCKNAVELLKFCTDYNILI